MSIIGWIVSIPVFCESGFVILTSLRKSVTKKLRVSAVTMSVALATGLYASHTLVPPTPGPIAAAGNLGLEDKLGYVILFGIFASAFAMIAGALSMLPGGLGGVEATMMALLLALGTNLDVGLAATAVIRLTTLWFAVGLGFAALPFALRLARKPENSRNTSKVLVEK